MSVMANRLMEEEKHDWPGPRGTSSGVMFSKLD